MSLIWSCGSGSQFSEKFGDDSSSPTFELFKQFKEQFCRSTFVLKYCDDRNSHEINQGTNTEELQQETMFLGVNLLDRFLSRGYFKKERSLEIAGTACLTLATRIEKNQPYNCVQKKLFYVGSTIYAWCEVVAMERLVQEVLNFQCFLPTLYNFLWFYLKAARANVNVEKTTKDLALLTLMGHQQLCYWPLIVAAALVIIASIATNQDASCPRPAMEINARHKDKELPECLKSMESLVKNLQYSCRRIS